MLTANCVLPDMNVTKLLMLKASDGNLMDFIKNITSFMSKMHTRGRILSFIRRVHIIIGNIYLRLSMI